VSDGLEREQEAQAGGVDIKTGARALRGVQFALQEGSSAGNGLLRGCRSADDGVEVRYI
jgi:hypothetical protein